MSGNDQRPTREWVERVAKEASEGNWDSEAQLNDEGYSLARALIADDDALHDIAVDRGIGYKTHDQCRYCGDELPEHESWCPTAIARATLLSRGEAGGE